VRVQRSLTTTCGNSTALSPRAGTLRPVNDEVWRPLGVETDEDVTAYDALHDGVPPWMESGFWVWIRDAISVPSSNPDGSGRFLAAAQPLTSTMCQRLRIPLPDIGPTARWGDEAKRQIETSLRVLKGGASPLQIADYLLANRGNAAAKDLEGLLERSKSAWMVGERAGHPGLVRRVPEGVQVAADATMARAGRAGLNLARAWENLYGLDPDASAAYRLAIRAVEDAVVPVVAPTDRSATLGKVIAQMESQKDWRLPMDRESSKALSGEVVVALMRLIWHGQHDRHGGQPSAPGNVSLEEAKVAVSAAVTLINIFHENLAARSAASPSIE